MVYSKAQNEANKRYMKTEEGKIKRKYWKSKSDARTFIRHYASEEDLNMIIEFAHAKLDEIKGEFELDSQNKFNQEIQENFHKKIKELGEKNE